MSMDTKFGKKVMIYGSDICIEQVCVGVVPVRSKGAVDHKKC
jgi:hypothetical protein